VSDLELVLGAVEDAQRILAEYIEPSPRRNAAGGVLGQHRSVARRARFAGVGGWSAGGPYFDKRRTACPPAGRADDFVRSRREVGYEKVHGETLTARRVHSRR
jgi:hypothetical protein